MRVLAFDLETIPDLATAARLWGIDPEHPDAFKHAEDRRFAEGEKPTTFMKPFMHRIVALGMVLMDTDLGSVAVWADAGFAEAQLIQKFHGWLQGGPVLVSWNGLAFDLPVLRYRAIHCGVALPRLYGGEGQKSWDKYDYRFGDRHYDLCDVLSGYGRSTSLKLSEFAAICGIPAKTEGAGDEVLTLWKAGDHAQIREYVAEDTRVTARGFLRWQVSRGRLEPKMVARLDENLAANHAGAMSAPVPELALGGVP